LQVAAGAEGLVAGSRDHDDAHLPVGVRTSYALAHGRNDAAVQGIALLGTVDGDPESRATALQHHLAGGKRLAAAHGFCLLLELG
jgi:hypothetical protein